ncbi:hypothetical protein [Kitasatospora sp. NPDC093806]|uniref:hypothetical protein n=1 Tax=Kitasatospora sp. NPDC093806 TaxID=3155075 RepID=UPI00342258E1
MNRLHLRAAGPIAVLLTTGLVALATPAHAAGPADLSAAITATGAPETVTYRSLFGNAGPNRAAGTVTAVVQLPTQAISATFDHSDCVYDNTAKTVSCDLSGMPEGEGFPLTVTAKFSPFASGKLTATATITGTDPDPNSANNSATVSCTALTGLVIIC